MSLLFDAAEAAVFRRTTEIPDVTSFTACGWAYRSSNTGSDASIFGMTEVPSFSWILFMVDGTTGKLQLTNGGPPDVNNASLFSEDYGNDVWFFWAITGAGSGENDVSGYAGRLSDANLEKVQIDGYSFTADELVFGNNQFAQPFDGAIAAFKVWDVVLTDEQIEAERWSLLPVHYADLTFYNPGFDVGSAETDLSGTADMTISGTVTSGEQPPIGAGDAGGGMLLMGVG